MKKIILLFFLWFFSAHAWSADCEDVSGATVTIQTSCTDLNITGGSSNVTINSGVTIDEIGGGNSTAVSLEDTTDTTLTNNGTISSVGNNSSSGNWALRNNVTSTITNLSNNGAISAVGSSGVRNGGTITIFTNTGAISAENQKGILSTNTGLIGTLINSGTISANEFGIRNQGTIGTLLNSQTISAVGHSGLWSGGTITSLTNSGTISAGGDAGIKIVSGGTIGTLTNSGTISAGGGFGIKNDQSSATFNTISTLINTGTISAATNGLWNDGTITTLTNSGEIKALTGDFGLKNVRGNIGVLTNSGTISAGNKWGIYNDAVATITTLTNTGTISASGNNIGIFNDSDSFITTLNNAQGASSSALTYRGKLPTNYNVIVNSTSDFGKTAFSDFSGTTNFGVHSSSTLNAGTYSSVIDGLSASDIASGTSGTFFSSRACNDVSGTSATVSADCGDLDISGNNSNVTVDSGVTVSGAGNRAWVLSNTSGVLWDLVVEDEKDVVNTGINTVFTNLGTISTDDDNGVLNDASASFDSLINSGTISAGDDFGVHNKGAINTLTNTGTISASGNNIGIYNSSGGSIATLNNSQGASSSALTYSGSLPTNYNVIVNSTSDFGRTTFSSVSGTTNFGVHSSSTLNVGTYSSVIDGLSASDIASGTSGVFLLPGACNDVSGASAAVSSDCGDLDISGNNSNVTIGSGVTVSGAGNRAWVLSNTSGVLWDLVVEDEKDVVNTGINTVFTNLGTISTDDDNGVLNDASASFASLINSGTISASDDFGLHNKGAINTLTNTGTISASGNNIGIYNSSGGSIATLNNSQGASSSALTYSGSLPTNYNVIVNSTSDFGRTTFSSVSGTTSFGIHPSSTLDKSSTYSSVLSGLSGSEIASGTSGSFVSGSTRHDWTLANSSGDLWDLVVAADQDITPDTNTSVTTSVKPNVVLGINNLNSVTEVNFANNNTYDCDLFDNKNICLSLGGRHTAINIPETRTGSVVWVGGYKLSDTLRVAGFYHRNRSHQTPASFELSDKTPMTGALIVWNQSSNRLGYQLKLANAYQQKNATLTREVVGSSEEGKGQAVIEAKSYVAELQYGYRFSDNTVLYRYLAARSAVIKQDGYTETGLSSPLSFNEIKDESTTVLVGLKFNTHLRHGLTLKGSLGVEHDIKHSVDKLEPTGISGLVTVSLTDSFNKTRPVVSAGFDYALKPNHRLSGIFQHQELPYESKTESNAYLYYTIGF